MLCGACGAYWECEHRGIDVSPDEHVDTPMFPPALPATGRYWDINLDVAFRIDADRVQSVEHAIAIAWSMLEKGQGRDDRVLDVVPAEVLFLGDADGNSYH